MTQARRGHIPDGVNQPRVNRIDSFAVQDSGRASLRASWCVVATFVSRGGSLAHVDSSSHRSLELMAAASRTSAAINGVTVCVDDSCVASVHSPMPGLGIAALQPVMLTAWTKAQVDFAAPMLWDGDVRPEEVRIKPGLDQTLQRAQPECKRRVPRSSHSSGRRRAAWWHAPSGWRSSPSVAGLSSASTRESSSGSGLRRRSAGRRPAAFSRPRPSSRRGGARAPSPPMVVPLVR